MYQRTLNLPENSKESAYWRVLPLPCSAASGRDRYQACKPVLVPEYSLFQLPGPKLVEPCLSDAANCSGFRCFCPCPRCRGKQGTWPSVSIRRPLYRASMASKLFKKLLNGRLRPERTSITHYRSMDLAADTRPDSCISKQCFCSLGSDGVLRSRPCNNNVE
jgi:hypothetical protein